MTARRAGILAVLLLLPWASLSGAENPPGIELPQADGGVLVLPGPAGRIVTLAPNLAELVFAAGAGERLVGVVEYSNYPEPARHVPRVGDAFRIDLERVVTLRPDLVIAWRSGNPQAAVQKLRTLGLKVWETEISRPEEIADSLENIARAAGSEATGAEIAQVFRERLDRLRRENADAAPLSYFFQISARPLYTVNGDHLISHGLRICGGRNIFADLPTLAPQVTRESVIQADPQVMISTAIEGQSPSLDSWAEWPHLSAVSNGHLLYLPADQISQAAPRLLDSIELACKLLGGIRKTTPTEH